MNWDKVPGSPTGKDIVWGPYSSKKKKPVWGSNGGPTGHMETSTTSPPSTTSTQMAFDAPGGPTKLGDRNERLEKVKERSEKRIEKRTKRRSKRKQKKQKTTSPSALQPTDAPTLAT